MKNLNKKTSILFITSIFIYFASFNFAGAINLPFGGRNVIPPVPCSCSGGMVWFTWLAPLHISGLPIKTGPVAFGIPPTSIWYSTYTPIAPFAWSLGRMITGAETCWTLGASACYLVPVVGHVYMTGSSTGFKP